MIKGGGGDRWNEEDCIVKGLWAAEDESGPRWKEGAKRGEEEKETSCWSCWRLESLSKVISDHGKVFRWVFSILSYCGLVQSTQGCSDLEFDFLHVDRIRDCVLNRSRMRQIGSDYGS
jgi:hypothetical protein